VDTPGRILATRYRLLERIGAGGMATVWRARDLRLERDVAIKILRPQFAEDPEFVSRFEVEARHAASVSHPDVATVFDTGVDGDERFIVMELVDGPSVAEILKARGPLPPGQAVDVAAAAARGLAAAHRRGLIHRDVKPANILVGRDGRVRLADFGIARALTTSRVTAPGTVLGSIPYLSPEQARGEEASAAGDVFSLGVVLYEMLTGRLPWDVDGAAAMATVRTTEPPVPLMKARPDLPPGLQRIVDRALRLDPAGRYPSARAFAESLDTWARRHASELPDEPDLAETATLVAAEPFAGAGGRDDALVSPIPTGLALAGAAIARPNPDLPTGPPVTPDRGATGEAVGAADGSFPTGQRPPVAEPARPSVLAPSSVAMAHAGPPTATSPWLAARARREAARPRVREEGRSRDRRGIGVLLAALIPAAAIAGLALATVLGAGAGGSQQPDATDAPAVALGPGETSTPSLAPATPLASSTVVPSSTPESTPAATPEPTRKPTPKPTERATPRPTAPPTTAVAANPARTVAKFYDAVEAHDWDTAIALWSPSMRRRYPPQQWLIDRFKRTTRIDLPRLRTVSVDRAAGRARVAVTLVEYRTVEPSPRTFSGSWDLVVINGRWRLNDPNF
jgi:serine/threonine-protein kinase